METPIRILDFMPLGFRFRPTDEELVDHYLKHMLLGDDFVLQIIPVIDLCKVEPWDIPALSLIDSDDQEWFFFSPRDYKYLKSTRSNRTTEHGYWKATGRDRNIKTRGTNKIIATKKTLVFHEGRVPNGVKTNYVIHEYHAVTFDVSQRIFVLCRLMRKAEKKPEGETDALVFEEGEPSSYFASDYEIEATAEGIPYVYNLPEVNLESIFPETPQAKEHNLQSIQQSPFCIDQETSSTISPFSNAHLRNENSFMQFPSETTEGEDNGDEFINSFLVDEDVVISEERGHAFVNDSMPSESLRMVHYESSDTDVEVVSAWYDNIPGTSTVCNEHGSSRKYHVQKMVKSSHGGTRPLSSTFEANRERKDSIVRDDFWGVETSSSDTTADKSLEINRTEIASSPSNLRRCKTQYHPRSDNFISQRAAAKRSQTYRKVSSNEISHLEAKKKLPIVESEKDERKAQNTTSRKNSETRSSQSSDANGKGSFICLETPSSSQGQFPRSAYFVNVVIGIFLFILIIWDVLAF